MIAIPFIYFLILLIFIVRRKRTFDISAYLVSLFLITSFFSILIDILKLRSLDTVNYEITLVPTFLYCFLLTLTLLPFYKVKIENAVSFRLKNQKHFNRIVYIYFTSFLIVLIFSFRSIIQILKGDMHELRIAMSRGESVVDLSLGGFHSIYILASVIGGYSMIMLLFYFYSKCFLNRSHTFNRMILISSITVIIIGILGVDRSKTIYWLITYGFMLVLFWRYMSAKQRKDIFKVSFILLSLVLSYFTILTISRFGEADAGTGGGLISYAGQSFINFCYFFDNVNYNELSLQRIFPWFYKLFINNDINSTTELNAYISWKTGKSIGVFSTFIGDIMVASGRWIAIIYCFVFCILSNAIFSFKNKKYIDFDQLILIFCLISIVMLGIFTHFYANYSTTIPFIFFMTYALYMNLSKKGISK